MSDEIFSPLVQVDIDRDKIKRAVKEALDDKAIEDLGKQITALSTQMAEGFAKSHQRHDIANGKLLKHESRLDNTEREIKDFKDARARGTFWERNQDKATWGIIGIVLMLFYFLLKQNGFPDFLN